MSKIMLVCLVLMCLCSSAFARLVPPEYYCDKCDEKITYYIFKDDTPTARGEISCHAWGRSISTKKIEYQLCDKHYDEFHRLMKGWLKVK